MSSDAAKKPGRGVVLGPCVACLGLGMYCKVRRVRCVRLGEEGG